MKRVLRVVRQFPLRQAERARDVAVLAWELGE